MGVGRYDSFKDREEANEENQKIAEAEQFKKDITEAGEKLVDAVDNQEEKTA